MEGQESESDIHIREPLTVAYTSDTISSKIMTGYEMFSITNDCLSKWKNAYIKQIIDKIFKNPTL